MFGISDIIEQLEFAYRHDTVHQSDGEGNVGFTGKSVIILRPSFSWDSI